MKIGFIGLGTMGRGMAANLLKTGHPVVVHDLFPKAAEKHIENGAQWADTPKALAEQSDVVFTSLPTPADVEAVVQAENGLAAGLRSGSAWFDLSTNSVDVMRRLHASLSEKGVSVFDAPVSGGPAGAASGRMAIWVGGDQEVFEKFKPILDAMADQILLIGPIGAGTIAKLVHNCASAAMSAVQVEVLSMGVKAGLDPLPLWEAIRQGAIGRQRTFEKLGTRFLPGKFDPPSFALKLVHKDIMLALQMGREFNVPMRLCNLVGQEITEALNRGWGDRDAQSFMLLQQERAGIPYIEVPMEKIKAVMEKS
ncbi:NAD(P)-dependent oxidoreductase [Bosea sp. (in: a-proteobacteria)]|uniref:NAD(P)-dependent oxidoreductase n=1 Tax=Bosea sp. (in: a-proteobacteria) TaxID=1871050 RepID=UPI00263221EF|nr:NAD(P)-dependent oxidoreductase [Bosea sp. (in: a-proteobacteria)]MCO5090038.1 NAD(P)-dependent oxidoreductase [Bosea sp. (in: a-proteobacteria)]